MKVDRVRRTMCSVIVMERRIVQDVLRRVVESAGVETDGHEDLGGRSKQLSKRADQDPFGVSTLECGIRHLFLNSLTGEPSVEARK